MATPANLHISYFVGTPDHSLFYAYTDAGGNWHFEVIEGPREGAYFIRFWSSIVLNGSGNPCVSYVGVIPDGSPTELKYAYKDDGGWHSEVVDTGGLYFENSLVLDANGWPHIAYYDDSGDGSVKYAYKDDEGWHTEVVAGGWYCSLALDTQGNPHISYGNDEDVLKYAYKDDEGWNYETADPTTYPRARNTSIALDEGDYPHIAYYARHNYDLKYAYKDDEGWQVETVDDVGYAGQGPSLVLVGGYPHISYTKPWASPRLLEYAYKDGEGWHIETADEVTVFYTTSLALNGEGYPCISYMDDIEDDLKFAYKDGSGWHTEIVDSEGAAGYYSSLALVPELVSIGAYTYYILA